ncbi:MAG: type II toxin-antitoxin system PemK/MazF family toxin [Acidimicrobiales bacterium]
MRRGDIHELRPPRRAGHELQGRRFGVVVQADALLSRSVVLVAPTSRSARAASFRPELVVEGATTRVLVERLGAVDVNRLGDHMGRASIEEIWGIDESLMTVLGLRDR